MLAPVPLAWLVLVRTLTHWATTALPLIVFAPLLAELLHLPHAQLPVLLVSLLLGTPLLSLIGAVVAALTVGMRRSGILVALLALPLYVRSEEHTSELQSLMRISYAVFCLRKKKRHQIIHRNFKRIQAKTQNNN